MRYLSREFQSSLDSIIMALARYGRQDIDAMRYWPLPRVFRYYERLLEMLEHENAPFEDS